MVRLLALLSLVVIAAGCGKPSEQLARLSEEFVYTTLSFSPATATSAGLHQYKNQKLDDLLDDMSPASIEKQRRFYGHFRDRLGSLNVNAFEPEDRADLRILQDQT